MAAISSYFASPLPIRSAAAQFPTCIAVTVELGAEPGFQIYSLLQILGDSIHFQKSVRDLVIALDIRVQMPTVIKCLTLLAESATMAAVAGPPAPAGEKVVSKTPF